MGCSQVSDKIVNLFLLSASQVSNKFYFTFTVSTESLGQQIRNVVPATEEEARRVIERMDAETER